VRISTAIAYLLHARARPNLTIRPRCLVDRVLLQGSRAVGLAILDDSVGGYEEVRGGRITLAAGAIGTPAILLRSGVGPADELNEFGIAPAADLPGVGANLIDHARVNINLTTLSAPLEDSPFLQVVGWCTAKGSAEENDLQLFLFRNDQQPVSRLGVGLMRPRSRGVLRLGDRDPWCPPDIRLNLASDPEDERRLVEGLRLLCSLASTDALAGQHTNVVTLDDGRSLPAADAFAALETTEDAARYVQRTVSHYVHPVGTARMGPLGDSGAVVDQYGNVYGLERLRVADASIMPNIPRANTNLTCIMIGERVAEWMRLE
jgi:choline dehydrogenase